MSQPFAQLVGKLVKQRTDQEITEEAFKCFNTWALMSTRKLVSLDEVAWVGALMMKALQSGGMDTGLTRHEMRDANGARVVGVVADDGVQIRDGAG